MEDTGGKLEEESLLKVEHEAYWARAVGQEAAATLGRYRRLPTPLYSAAGFQSARCISTER